LGGGPGSESDYQKATNAIDHIGVAALPFLVKWVSRSLAFRLKFKKAFPIACVKVSESYVSYHLMAVNDLEHVTIEHLSMYRKAIIA